MFERFASASLRSRDELAINLVAQGPIGGKAIKFNNFRENSIQTVEDLLEHICSSNGEISTTPKISISKNFYTQARGTSVEAILRIVAPKLPIDEVDIIVSHDIDLSTTSHLRDIRRTFLVSISEIDRTQVEAMSDKCWAIRCSEQNGQDILISTAASIGLLNRFPFTLISSPEEQRTFFSAIKRELEQQGHFDSSGLLEITGVPAPLVPGIARTWLKVLCEQFNLKELKLNPSSAAAFICKSWTGQGGALSETRLTELLRSCMTTLTDHRPDESRFRKPKSALEAILSQQAILAASLVVPNNERQISLATLMRLDNFRRHRNCVLSKKDLHREDVRSYFDERSLEAFDTEHLICLSNILSQRG